MSGIEVLDLGRDAVWAAIFMAAPVMIAGLVVGLSIALLQALTQVQEMTLVFVPKILAIFATLLVFLPFMGAQIARFSQDVFARIASF